VMLYSIGKDSAVHAAPGAEGLLSGAAAVSRCCTSTPTWKFREMSPSATHGARAGIDLLVHTNPEGVAQGINPFTHGSPSTPTS
jgi:sulfate adenylyltransferase subunit 2